ncbi:MAG: 4-hydroxyphenylacetate 3-hydroxylase N-terminal domain-containing protein [Dehalococcoidales bacterium]|nr:4-hydroxyphenylacetate 3-hydroxylase N-terminal domain-containing protein [Dehalococcoidales bacterium]
MTVKTAEQYYESLKEMKPTAYVLGEKVKNVYQHPLIKGQVAGVAQTFALAHDPEGEKLLVTESKLAGEKVNRFVKLYESVDDLIAKIKMLKFLSQRIGTCYMRCTGLDAINAVGITTYDIDKKYNTGYHQRFKDWLKFVQKNDFVVWSGVTDVKGDRSLRPADQPDPDMYLHIIQRRDDGIVVRGAKAHQSGSLCSHWGLIIPSREMRQKDKDYAVCFAVPTDAKGVIHVYGRGTLEERALEGIDMGNVNYSKFAPMVIFDDVFIPWENVFLCGEYEFAGQAVRAFGSYHRHSHGGCKCGVGDVLIGAAATIADYNGIPDTSHINAKLVDMIKTVQTMYGCSIAASVEATRHNSGIYQVDSVLANTSKLYEGKEYDETIRMLVEIAGGFVADLPSEKDLHNPEIGHFIDKYLKGKADVPTEDRMRMYRLIEKLAFETRDIVSNIHGGGSPEAHRMTLLRDTDLEPKKKLAKKLAGIKDK